MPIYFDEVAPHCPVSRDQPVGPMSAPTIRTNIPIAFDLASAIAAANLLRSIINQMIFDKVINNVYSAPTPPVRTQPADRVIKRTRTSRWSEVPQMRVKRKYKYYLKNPDGTLDKEVWIMTERMEQMGWYDKSWRTGLSFQYGEKGEGELVGGLQVNIDESTGEGL